MQARSHFVEADRIMREGDAQERARPAHHVCGLPGDPRKLIKRGWSAPRAPREGVEAAAVSDDPALRVHLMPRTVHVIGAGLSGLAAAIELSERGARVIVHEAGAGRRAARRSYYDPNSAW